MTALLVGITLVALGVAGTLAFYVLRLARENRERHEARAAALADRIGGHARDVELLEPSGGRLVADGAAAPMLFADVDTTPRSGSPWLLAAGVVVVAVALGGIYVTSRSGAAAAASEGPSPIELTSLRHERSGEALVVTGVVHNPGRGRAYDDLAAVVFAFDRDGSYLTSGRAGLDYRRLSPGEESPFSITLPSAAGVARYRVSFRTDAAVVPHLDRRNQPAPIEGGDQ
jgi:hypothetical protein